MHESHDDNQLHLPDELVRELKARDVSQPFVPASVDEAVLARAREQFAAVAKADLQQDRGEIPGPAAEGTPGATPGAGDGGKRKAVFWGRTALAGVGSVAAALAIAALLATDPTSPPTTQHAESVQFDFDQMLAYGEAPPAASPMAERKLEANRPAPAPTAAPAFSARSSGYATDERATGDGFRADRPMLAESDATSEAKDMVLADGMVMGREDASDHMPADAARKDAARGPMQDRALATSELTRDATINTEIPQAARTAVAPSTVAGNATPAPQDPAPQDIDRSGRVDILDVYLLARQREAGDTTITQAAIDAMAAQVVRLARSEGGSL